MNYVAALPDWERYLIFGILVFITISSCAVVLTRMGRSPYWAFVMLFPYLPIIPIWYLAFSAWPKRSKKPS